MSMQNLVDYEIRRIRRGTIRSQLWKLRELIAATMNNSSMSEKEFSYRMLYDVVVSTEYLEKEIDKKRNYFSRAS